MFHVNDAPIGPGNENNKNDENDEKGRRKRKRRGGGKGKSNLFWIVLINTGRVFWRIEEIAYLSVTQKASDFQAEVNADKCHRIHESYELKWAGERNAD